MIEYSNKQDLTKKIVLPLYQQNNWSAATKPSKLVAALNASHSLVTAWHGTDLVGLGNAISDGHLVVYYPHLLILPAYQRMGIGRELMSRLQAKYIGFHQQMLVADEDAILFYQRIGFRRAGVTQSYWIYNGDDH
jgi:ribosomal protein S18 acetylase RimI-like enzyme